MRQDVIAIGMAASAVVALALLVRAIWRARAAGDLDASTLLTLGLGWLVSLPIVVAVLSGGYERRVDAARELVPVLPGWYELAAHATLAAALALAGGLLAILLWTIAWLASGLHGGRLLSLSGIALLICLLAATVLPRGRGASVGVAIVGVTLAAASGLLAAISFDQAFVPCRHECVLGSSLTGILPNENLLGTTLLAALPFTYLGLRGRTRTWLVVYIAAMAFATGSRGAMLGSLIVLVALLALRPRLDADRPAPRRVAMAGALLGVAILASVYIVQHDWSATSYSLTDRPQLWSTAAEYTSESPAFGYGPAKWETLYTETGEIPRAGQHSTHNQWVDVLFNAGWVGVLVLIAMIAAMIRSAGYARSAVLVTLAAIFLIGVSERAWSIGSADFVSFSLIALVLMGPTRPGTGRPEMSLGGYLQLVRSQRWIVAGATLMGVATAVILAAATTPTYAIKTQFVVSSRAQADQRTQAFEGGLHAQQRARSYAEIISGPRGARAAAALAGPPTSASEIDGKIRVGVPPNTVLLNVTVEDQDPGMATAIAAALDQRVPRLVERLEGGNGGDASPVAVSVTRPARIPSTPVAPRAPIYIALGALLGLVLGLATAMLRSRIGQRVQARKDVGAAAGAPVLASIPRHAAERRPVFAEHPSSAAADAYRKLRVSLGAIATEHGLSSFVVSSARPGEGKTEVAANLGLALAEAGRRVVVVDANLRSPALGGLLGTGSAPGLADVLEGSADVDDALWPSRDGKIQMMPSGIAQSQPYDLLESDALAAILGELEVRFDVVLVDAPALLALADAATIARRAAVILVTDERRANAADLKATLKALDHVEARPVGVVVNRSRAPYGQAPDGTRAAAPARRGRPPARTDRRAEWSRS